MTPSKAKEIIKAYNKFVDRLPVGSYNDTVDTFLESPQADAILSGEDWISVEDRLPENLGWCNDQVLFVASESVRKGCYDYEDGFWHELDGGKYQDIGRIKNGEKPNGAVVTHWMPLPQPPKP